MRLQVGKLNFISVCFERILVGPDNFPIDHPIERFPGVPVNAEHVEDVHQMAGVRLQSETPDLVKTGNDKVGY